MKTLAIAVIATLTLDCLAAAEEPIDAAARTAANAIQQYTTNQLPQVTGRAPGAGKPHTGVYVFISSSIPETSLIEIAKDAAPLKIPVVLRGLVGESLQDTLVRMHSLIKVGAALEIDPLLFEAYKIERVPAVVRTCGVRGEGPYAVVYGIVPSKALPVLRKILSCGS